MKNSMIYKIKTGQDLFSSGSYGYESTFNSDFNVYDEDYVAALEALIVDLEYYKNYSNNAAICIGSEDWDPDIDPDYELAEESWASIKQFFSTNASRVSNFFKSLFKKAEKVKRDVDIAREKQAALHKEIMEMKAKLKDEGLSDIARKTIQKNIQIRQRDLQASRDMVAKATRMQREVNAQLEAAAKKETKSLHDVGKAEAASANQKAYRKSKNEAVGRAIKSGSVEDANKAASFDKYNSKNKY